MSSLSQPLSSCTVKDEDSKPKALVIGCTGAFGGAVAKELIRCGWAVTALMRTPENSPTWLSKSQVFVGDCLSFHDVEKAAEGVKLIVYAANPSYLDWQDLAEAMLEPVAMIAEKNALHILFPGNIYGYDPLKTPIISENTKPSPITDKGVIRQRMERRLEQASRRGATVTLIRTGDFLVKNSDSSVINRLLVKRKTGWKLYNPSPSSHYHSFAWLPDVAANAVALLCHDKKGFNVWNDPGIVTTHQQWLWVFKTLGIPIQSKPFPWGMLRAFSWFHPMSGEIMKIRYLWQHDLILDGTKIQSVLKTQYRTRSLTDIVKELLEK